MFTQQIILKPATQDHIYTELCNKMEHQGVFMACGNCDDKWIIGKWEDEIDFLAWCVAMGIAVPPPPSSSNSDYIECPVCGGKNGSHELDCNHPSCENT